MARRLIFSFILFGFLSFPLSSAIAQTNSKDCEELKQEIRDLQDELANLTADVANAEQHLKEMRERVHKDIDIVKANKWPLNDEAYSKVLDELLNAENQILKLSNQIEEMKLTIQAIKDEIADLLNQLANCGKTKNETTEPQKENKSIDTSHSNQKVSMSGFHPIFQLRGFGGASFINGHTPATAGLDGAVLFPIGNRVLIGPTAGFQWVNSSIVNLLNAGGGTFSTSANTFAGNVGVSLGMGPVVFDFNAWRFGIRAGATITSSTIKQVQSSTNPTSGTTFTSSTTKHNTTVAPFLGGYISHNIFNRVGVFVEYDYHFSSGPDLHYSDAVAGAVLSFGRHSAK